MSSDSIGHTVKSIVESAGHLGTLPTVYEHLRRVLSDPKVSAKEVGAVIEHDQALTSRVLKVANSAFYGFPKRVTTVTQAVIVLGFNEVKNLALSISIIDMFGGRAGTGILDQAAFWRHSLAAAVAAGAVARISPSLASVKPELAFVAGLIHDIGKLALDQNYRSRYETALRCCREEGGYLVDAERTVLGFTHEAVGKYLAVTWNLPGPLVAAAGHHHGPAARRSVEAEHSLACAVYAADSIVRAMGLGSGGDPFVPASRKDCWAITGLAPEELARVVVDTARVFSELSTFLLPRNGGAR